MNVFLEFKGIDASSDAMRVIYAVNSPLTEEHLELVVEIARSTDLTQVESLARKQIEEFASGLRAAAAKPPVLA